MYIYMQTQSNSISDVLTTNATSFFIPPFQRAYAWGKTEITRFFDDIMTLIKSEMDDTEKDKKEHFFGTLVIRPEVKGTASKQIIVDGQQRLTTTLLYLIALRDLESNEQLKEDINTSYLTNGKSTFQDKIKLKQVTKDWDAYKALVKNEQPLPGLITSAYTIFIKLIQEAKLQNPQIKFDHFIIAIQRMNVAVIILDDRLHKGEDPQIIFETLNSLGKPLTLSDLIRNFVLLNMNSDSQSDIYEEIWHPKIENVFGEKTSYFFRDYLQYKKASPFKVVSDGNTKELYELFKKYVNETFPFHKDFINDIIRYVDWYKWIITEEEITDKITTDEDKNIEIKELLRNIFHDIQSEAFKPFVLGLFECYKVGLYGVKMNDEIFITTLKTIRTYLIRRRILGLSQGENKNIVLLCKDLKDLSEGNTTMVHLLSNMFYRMKFPNDDEIRNGLITKDFYNELTSYAKFVLGKIEENNSKVAVNFRNPKITIEHIMPQKLNETWKAELGSDFENIHHIYLHNIGNLILTEFNSEMGNKSFEEKKTKLHTSSLYYRLNIIKNSKWDEDTIKNHQRNMIECFLATFPLPESFKYKSNWNSKVAVERDTFSPLDENTDDFEQCKKPLELRIYNSIYKVASWRDLFIKFVDYLRHDNRFDFASIVDNQEEIFRRERVIIKWGLLKQLIDEGVVDKTWYKNFQGLYFDKVKDLHYDELFIKTGAGFSAGTCIARINKFMKKFNMSENDVVIKIEIGE